MPCAVHSACTRLAVSIPYASADFMERKAKSTASRNIAMARVGLISFFFKDAIANTSPFARSDLNFSNFQTILMIDTKKNNPPMYQNICVIKSNGNTNSGNRKRGGTKRSTIILSQAKNEFMIIVYQRIFGSRLNLWLTSKEKMGPARPLSLTRAGRLVFVDLRGVGPRPRPCHGRVLPLNYRPLFLWSS